MNRNTRSASIAILGLAFALPGFAQAPDARAGAVIVETQKPPPRTTPVPAVGTAQPIVVVGGRNRPGSKPPKKLGAAPAPPKTTRPSP